MRRLVFDHGEMVTLRSYLIIENCVCRFCMDVRYDDVAMGQSSREVDDPMLFTSPVASSLRVVRERAPSSVLVPSSILAASSKARSP